MFSPKILYWVQIGAFVSKANAGWMAVELWEMEYGTMIKAEK